MATRTIGTSGADHVDINAWVAYVVANNVTSGNLTENVAGAVKAVGVTSTATQTISGWAAAGFTTTLTANAGDSFKDNASVQTNALFYSTANGAFYALTSAAASIDVQVNLFRCTYLQIKNTVNYGGALYLNTATIDDSIIDGNILHATLEENGVLMFTSSSTNTIIRNNLIVNERGGGGSCCVSLNGGFTSSGTKALVHDNTFWGSNSGPTGPFAVGSYGYAEFKGNAFVFGAGCSINGRDAQCTGSNNATYDSAWDGTSFGAGTLTGLTSSQFSITVANEVVDGDATPTDFRLKSGGTALQNTGLTISGVTTDIAGTTRPSGATEDIGCWEFVTAGAATPIFVPTLLLMGVG